MEQAVAYVGLHWDNDDLYVGLVSSSWPCLDTLKTTHLARLSQGPASTVSRACVRPCSAQVLFLVRACVHVRTQGSRRWLSVCLATHIHIACAHSLCTGLRIKSTTTPLPSQFTQLQQKGTQTYPYYPRTLYHLPGVILPRGTATMHPPLRPKVRERQTLVPDSEAR